MKYWTLSETLLVQALLWGWCCPFPHPWTLDNVWRQLWLSQLEKGGKRVGGDTSTWWVEAKDAVKNTAMYKTIPITENYLVSNVTGTEVKEPWSCVIRGIIVFIFPRLNLEFWLQHIHKACYCLSYPLLRLIVVLSRCWLPYFGEWKWDCIFFNMLEFKWFCILQ